MRIHRFMAAATGLILLGAPAYSQSGKIAEAVDAYHLAYWQGTSQLPEYTEWWYFNLYDSSNNVQALFSYLVSNPLNLPGGVFPFGVAEMATAVFTQGGVVNEADVYPTSAFSSRYDKADVQIGPANGITVMDVDTYRIFGQTQDGRIAWNLLYRRAGPSWLAASRFPVSADPAALMSWLVDMPRADVSGTLTIDGTSYTVKAPGYHDHNWGEWNLNGVTWNWGQYSRPGLAFDLGDFPEKPGGRASITLDGQRFIFESGEYTLTHTKWAYDPTNNLYYPTQSIFVATNADAHVSILMDVQQSDPLTTPLPPPKAVIYEQLVTYTGEVSTGGNTGSFQGNGFKEYTAIAK